MSILGAEYLHADFSDISTNNDAFFVAGTGFVSNPVDQRAHLQANILRLRSSKLF
jgi:hypothetical protein